MQGITKKNLNTESFGIAKLRRRPPVAEIYLTTPVEGLLLSLPAVEILQEYWEPPFRPEQVLPLQRWKTMEKFQ